MLAAARRHGGHAFALARGAYAVRVREFLLLNAAPQFGLLLAGVAVLVAPYLEVCASSLSSSACGLGPAHWAIQLPERSSQEPEPASATRWRLALASVNNSSPLDLALQLHHPIQQGFRSGWTAGHIDIDGNDAVAPSNHRVRIVVIAAAVRA